MQVVNVGNYGGRDAAERQGVVYAGRPGVLGNPFVLSGNRPNERAAAIEQYRRWLWAEVQKSGSQVRDAIHALPGDAVLGCYCKPLDCHCDVIVRCWKYLHGVA